MHEPSAAEKYFRLALGQSEDTTMPFVHLGGILREQGKFEESLQLLSQGLSCAGDVDEVLFNMALSLRSLGRISEAHEMILESLALDPGYAAAEKLRREFQQALSVAEIGRAHV